MTSHVLFVMSHVLFVTSHVLFVTSHVLFVTSHVLFVMSHDQFRPSQDRFVMLHEQVALSTIKLSSDVSITIKVSYTNGISSLCFGITSSVVPVPMDQSRKTTLNRQSTILLYSFPASNGRPVPCDSGVARILHWRGPSDN